VEEVLEFTAGPDEDWGALLITLRVAHSLDSGAAVRVVIARGTPRDSAIAALRDIARTLEIAGAHPGPPDPMRAEVSRWFAE
jgi:hypothetical protein